MVLQRMQAERMPPGALTLSQHLNAKEAVDNHSSATSSLPLNGIYQAPAIDLVMYPVSAVGQRRLRLQDGNALGSTTPKLWCSVHQNMAGLPLDGLTYPSTSWKVRRCMQV
jgi:hypothetical protein